MPGGQSQFPSWLEYSQHLEKSVNREERNITRAADHGIEGIGGNGRRSGGDDFKLCVREPKMAVARRAASTISGQDRSRLPALGADKGSYRQAGSPGPVAMSRTVFPLRIDPSRRELA